MKYSTCWQSGWRKKVDGGAEELRQQHEEDETATLMQTPSPWLKLERVGVEGASYLGESG